MKPVGLKLYGTHQLLVYADDVNLLWDNLDAIKKNTDALIDASKEAGLEVRLKTGKTKYISRCLVTRMQDKRITYSDS
jgi:hypothetical protein